MKINKKTLKQKARKISSVVLVVALLLSLYTVGGISALASESTVSNEADFVTALNDASVDRIIVDGSFTITGAVPDVSRDLTIIGKGNDLVINGFCIAVKTNTLSLENITLVSSDTEVFNIPMVEAKHINFSASVFIKGSTQTNVVVADTVTVADNAVVSIWGGGGSPGLYSNALTLSDSAVVGANAILDLRQGDAVYLGANNYKTTGRALQGSGTSEAVVILNSKSKFIVNAGKVDKDDAVNMYLFRAYVKKPDSAVVETNNDNTIRHDDRSGVIRIVSYTLSVETITFPTITLGGGIEAEIWEKIHVPVSITPVDAAGSVVFSSDDPSLVSIESFKNGLLELDVKAAGKVTITATAGLITSTFTVYAVVPDPLNFPSIAFTQGEVNINPGTSINLKKYVDVVGNNISSKIISFYNVDGSPVLPEFANGMFTADDSMIGKSYVVGVLGSFIVNGKAQSSYDTIVIHVKKEVVAIQEIIANDYTMVVDEIRTLAYWAIPDNHTETLSVSSDNIGVVAYNINDGKLYAKSEGTAIVKIISKSGTAKNILVTVSSKAVAPVNPVKIGIYIPDELLPIIVGESKTFTAVFDADVTERDVTWESLNPAVGTINSKGAFTALAAGNASIKVTSTADPSIFHIYSFTVDPAAPLPVPITEIFADDIEMVAGEIRKLDCWASPADHTETISASSDTNGVVEVNGTDGKLYAKSEGTAVVTITSTGGVFKKINVTVSKKPAVPVKPVQINIYIPNELLPIVVGESKTFAAIFDAGVTERGVTWESLNPGVGTIDNNGAFTALTAGNASIKVTSTADPSIFVIYSFVVAPAAPLPAPITEINAFNTLTMLEGTAQTLDFWVLPTNHTDSVVITSDNKDVVAYVNGELHAIAPGTATIKIVSTINNVVKNIVVTVLEKPVTPIAVTDISIYNPSGLAALNVGETRKFSYSFNVGASDTRVTWDSSNPDVGTINAAGVFRALEPGTTEIRVTSVANPWVFDTLSINVFYKDINVSLIEHNDTATIDMDTKDFFLKPVLHPFDYNKSNIRYISQDTSIVLVDATTGRLDPQGVGYADVIIRDLITGVSKKVTVFVNDGYVKATSVQVSLSKTEIEVGENIRPEVIFTPKNATNKNYHISSNNPDHIQYDATTGYIRASKIGTYTMTIHYEDGTETDHFEVKVVQKSITIKEIVASDDTVYMVAGDSKMISYTTIPANATDTNISYSSNDLNVVTVDADGIIRAIAAGHTTISIKDYYTGVEKLVEVIVLAGPIKITGLDFEKPSYNTVVGDEINPKVIFTPNDTTERDVRFVSSKPTVAYVNEVTGKVTAIGTGEAVITVISNDNDTVEASTTIYVERKLVEVTDVYFPTEMYLTTDDELVNTNWTVNPFGADYTVSFESVNKNAVLITVNGVLKPVAKGVSQVIMTVTDNSNGKVYTKTCAVTVSVGIIALTDFTVNSPIEIEVGRQSTLNVNVIPLNASDVKITYKSLNPTTAHVNEDGIVTGLAVGDTKIEVKVEAHGVVLVKEVDITVKPFIIQPEEIVIENCPLYVDEGGKPKQIKWKVMPENASDKSVTFTAENIAGQEGFVTVSKEDGWVNGITAGNANVTITTSNGLKFNCPIVVTPKVVKVTGIGLNYTSLTLKAGASTDLIATVYPTNAAEKSVSWHSNDLSVATVDQKGRVTTHKAGTVEITVKTLDGDFTAVCSLTVVDKDIDVAGISITPKEVYLDVSDTEFNLNVTVYPTNATNQAFDITSSNTDVVTVSSTGKLTPKKEGMAIITVQTKDKKHTAKSTIYVVTRATGISINPSEKTLIEGETVQVNATVLPAGSNQGVIYTSADSSIASVTSDGLVVANKMGTTTITAKSVDGGYSISCAITVRAKTTGIIFIPSMAKIQPGQSYETMIRGTAAGSSVKGLEFKTSDPNIAVVDKYSGVITAIKPGIATIYAVDSENYSAEFIIEVFQPITNIIVPEKVTLEEGKIIVVDHSVIPSNANNAKKLIWTSKDTKIADVDGDGVIYGKSFGSTIVTVRSPDGNVVKHIKVNVVRATPDFVRKTIYMLKGSSFLIKDDLGIKDNRSYTFKSFNAAKATVSDTGSIRAVAKGEVIVEAYCEGVRFAEYTVIVKDKVDKLSINPEFIHLLHNDTGTKLTPLLSSEDVFYVSYTFSSSNTAVASVSSEGFVIPKAPGITIITITSSTGLTAQANIHVKKAELISKTVTLKPGQKYTPNFNVDDINYGKGSGFLPGTTDSSDIVWKSNNPTVATVDPVTGEITSVGAGVAIITAALRGNTQVVDRMIVEVLAASTGGNGGDKGGNNGGDKGGNNGGDKGGNNGGNNGNGNTVKTGQTVNTVCIATFILALLVFIVTSRKSKKAAK